MKKSIFTFTWSSCNAAIVMSLKKTSSLLLLIPWLLAGCASHTITNLTPSQLPRNETGYYPIEMAFESNQQSMRHDSIKPYVVVGFDAYEMRTTLGIQNRYEALIPVPADKEFFNYTFKVNYEYNRMGKGPGRGSKLSRLYTLRISEE